MKLQTTLGLIIFCYMSACTDIKKTDTLNKTISIQTDSITTLKNKTDSLNKLTINLKAELNFWFEEEEINKLKEKGILNPEKDITDNLIENTQLIPYPGVLGGTMRIGNIKLLGDRWVIAYFADGHIDGQMILRYIIKKDSTIGWVVIDHYIN